MAPRRKAADCTTAIVALRTIPGRYAAAMSYLAGILVIAFVVFGWSFWPLGIVLIPGLVIADVLVER